MRLIGYIRVSTDEQDIGEGVQRRAINAFCDLFPEHSLEDVFTDHGVSGGTALDKRPGGKRLLKALLGGRAEGVLTHQMDRLFRSIVDGVQTCDKLNRAGIDILTVYDKIDTSHPDGWMSLGHRLVASEWERRKIAWRTHNAMQSMRARGACYGHPQFGIVAAGPVRDGRKYGERLYRDPETWPVRERIVRAYRDGTAPTLRALRGWLIEQRVPAPKGGGRWGLNTLSRLIRSHDDFKDYPFLPAADETGVSG